MSKLFQTLSVQTKRDTGSRKDPPAVAGGKTLLSLAVGSSADRLGEIAKGSGSGVHAEPAWYMKGDDESVYGPVGLMELWSWACQCRIGPTHMMSQDKKTWSPAESVPELGMEWSCNLPDGTPIGPLNPFAFREQVASGDVTAEASVHNRRTDETITIGALVKATEDGLPLLRSRFESDTIEREKEGAAEAERCKKMEEELAKVKAELAQAVATLATVSGRAGALHSQQGPVGSRPPNRLSERVLLFAQAVRDANMTKGQHNE